MRIGFLAVAALFIGSGASIAADPAIVFQTHPVGQVLDELRIAADLLGGEKGVKSLNNTIMRALGEKGFEGLDIGRPIFGYVLLAPKPEDITAVVALPITSEKDFLDLCERANHQKPKLAEKVKDVYELPPLDRRYKALMRFKDQYAYISYGAKPAPALEPKSLIPMQQIYVPTEKGLIAGRLYFDRIPLAVKLALPTLMEEVKKTILGSLYLDRDDQEFSKAIMPELEKLITRYAKLANGADELGIGIRLDVPTGNLIVEATLAGKPGAELSTIIAARKPTGNKFGALLATPDTIAGFKFRLPFFEQEIRDATSLGLESLQKQLAGPFPPMFKAPADELFKGLVRTVKTGQFDIVSGIRGPDKNGMYSIVVAVAFEDPSALEKEFIKLIATVAPPEAQAGITWDAAKAGKVSIHTWKAKSFGLDGLPTAFGGEDSLFAFAFAPHGIFVVLGPDAVATITDALAVKPAESPVLDVVVNPAQFAKFLQKANPNNAGNVEAILGKEDKLISAMSMTVSGGKELKATYTINLRMIPRAAAADNFDRDDKLLLDPEDKVVEIKLKPRKNPN